MLTICFFCMKNDGHSALCVNNHNRITRSIPSHRFYTAANINLLRKSFIQIAQSWTWVFPVLAQNGRKKVHSHRKHNNILVIKWNISICKTQPNKIQQSYCVPTTKQTSNTKDLLTNQVNELCKYIPKYLKDYRKRCQGQNRNSNDILTAQSDHKADHAQLNSILTVCITMEFDGI